MVHYNIGHHHRAKQSIAKYVVVIAAIIGIGYYIFLTSECISHWQTLLQGCHNTVITLTGRK